MVFATGTYVRLVILLSIFRYILYTNADEVPWPIELAFAQTSILPGEDIVVTWNLDGSQIEQFTLKLLKGANVNGLIVDPLAPVIASQNITTNGKGNGQTQFSSQKLEPGSCFARAVTSNSTTSHQDVLAETQDDSPLTIRDPTSTSSTTTTAGTVSSTTSGSNLSATKTSQSSATNTFSAAETSVNASNPEASHSTPNLGNILGLALGIPICITAVVLVVVFLICRHRRRRRPSFDQELAPSPFVKAVTVTPQWTQGAVVPAGLVTRNEQLEEEVHWWRRNYTPEWNPGQDTITGAPPTYPGSERTLSPPPIEVPVRPKRGAQ